MKFEAHKSKINLRVNSKKWGQKNQVLWSSTNTNKKNCHSLVNNWGISFRPGIELYSKYILLFC